jgi:DNA-directed RNA polymerase specialized sigma24 family protein
MTMSYAQPSYAQPRRHVVPALWRQVVRNAPVDRTAGKGDHRSAPVEPDRSAYAQLEIYEGVLSAFERRAEVLELVAACPDRETSVRRLRERLDLTPAQAAAVLDLPLHRFTSESRDRIAHRAAELRSVLIR